MNRSTIAQSRVRNEIAIVSKGAICCVDFGFAVFERHAIIDAPAAAEAGFQRKPSFSSSERLKKRKRRASMKPSTSRYSFDVGELHLLKSRNGATGEVQFRFNVSFVMISS